jgi:hypothetical protein
MRDFADPHAMLILEYDHQTVRCQGEFQCMVEHGRPCGCCVGVEDIDL